VSAFPSARINLAALQHNFSIVKQHAPDSRVMSVIKANAYGHDMATVATALHESDAYAVARLKEGIDLREQGVHHPIVVLEGVHAEQDFRLAAAFELSPVIHHLSQIDTLNHIQLNTPLSFVWLMVDSGMHRLGISPEHVVSALDALKDNMNIDGEVQLMSHFANADWIGDKRNGRQLGVMTQLGEQTGLALCLANSAAVLSLPDSHQDWVRPGLMLYGISPFEDKTAFDLNLKPVMKLVSQLIGVYDIAAGEQVGYGGTWTADSPTRVGVVSIGYGDGYNRHLSNQAEVLINQQRVPVIGRVSMDTICVNLNDIPEAQIGDEVILWGDEKLPVERVAAWANTIAYELVTCMTDRLHKDVQHG
jgi:alanine racemase